MATSARKENRWRKQLWEENDIRDRRTREAEAMFMSRAPRKPVNVIDSKVPSKTKIRNWMLANAPEHEGPTQLVESANTHFDLPESWIGEETHWIWDLGADAYDD